MDGLFPTVCHAIEPRKCKIVRTWLLYTAGAYHWFCGLVQAIKRAHEDVKPGMLQVTAGELLDANANRSPTGYLANPPEERARYKHNTDKTMTLLKVLDTAER